MIINMGEFKRRGKDNIYIDKGDYFEVACHKRNGEIRGYFKIDREDHPFVSKFRWCMNDHYVISQELNLTKLHIFLIGKVEGKDIDHINRDKYDNRKSNLRHVDRSVNVFNRILKSYSNVPGVWFRKDRNTWRVSLVKNNKDFGKSGFKSFYDAVEARKKLELEIYGEQLWA